MFRYLLTGGLGGGIKDALISLLLSLPIILFSLTLHECAHGWVANKLGDRTAANLGRLTLDPRKHLDPIGTICMVLFGFGWAKPVPINARNFKNPRRGMALTAAAGPAANLVLGFIFALLYEIVMALLRGVTFASANSSYYFFYFLIQFLFLGLTLNVYLALFNLLPIPPLDGGVALRALAGERVVPLAALLSLGTLACLALRLRPILGIWPLLALGWMLLRAGAEYCLHPGEKCVRIKASKQRRKSLWQH